MYPRLHLARTLLAPHGVILISIDDDEAANLRAILNEIFGEDNFCGTFIWEKKREPSFLDAMMGSKTEYVVAYAKDKSQAAPFTNGTVEQGKMYPFNNAGNPLTILTFPANAVDFTISDCILEPQDMSEGNIKQRYLTAWSSEVARTSGHFGFRANGATHKRRLTTLSLRVIRSLSVRIPFRPNYITRRSATRRRRISYRERHRHSHV